MFSSRAVMASGFLRVFERIWKIFGRFWTVLEGLGKFLKGFWTVLQGFERFGKEVQRVGGSFEESSWFDGVIWECYGNINVRHGEGVYSICYILVVGGWKVFIWTWVLHSGSTMVGRGISSSNAKFYGQNLKGPLVSFMAWVPKVPATSKFNEFQHPGGLAGACSKLILTILMFHETTTSTGCFDMSAISSTSELRRLSESVNQPKSQRHPWHKDIVHVMPSAMIEASISPQNLIMFYISLFCLLLPLPRLLHHHFLLHPLPKWVVFSKNTIRCWAQIPRDCRPASSSLYRFTGMHVLSALFSITCIIFGFTSTKILPICLSH